MTKIQLLSLAVSIIYLLVILWNVRSRRIKEAYALIGILAGIAMVLVSVWTKSLDIISNWIGIKTSFAALFLFMLGCIILVLLQYSMVLSRSQERVSRLAQEIALLKEELRKLKEQK